MTRLSAPKEADLKKAIEDYLQFLENQGKLYYDRINSGKLVVLNSDGLSRVVRLAKTGSADLYFVAFGRVTYIETKRKGEKQKPQQKEFQDKVESVGAFYFCVDSFEQFLDKISEYGLTN